MLLSLSGYKRARSLAGYGAAPEDAVLPPIKDAVRQFVPDSGDEGQTTNMLKDKGDINVWGGGVIPGGNNGLFVRWADLSDRWEDATTNSKLIQANWNAPEVVSAQGALVAGRAAIIEGLRRARSNWTWDWYGGRGQLRQNEVDAGFEAIRRQLQDAGGYKDTLDRTAYALRQGLAARQQASEIEAQAAAQGRAISAQDSTANAALSLKRTQAGVAEQEKVRAVMASQAAAARADEAGISQQVDLYLKKLAAPKVAGIPVMGIISALSLGAAGFLIFRVAKKRKAKKAARAAALKPAMAGYRKRSRR